MKTRKEYLIKRINDISLELNKVMVSEIDKISETSKININKDNKNTYTINSSDLFTHNNWSPSYHKFSFILKSLVEIVNRKGTEYVLAKLIDLKNMDAIYLNNKYIKIHPELKKQLLQLI